MSVKEVTLLRKSGNLKEAYKMAIDDLKEDRNNPWAQKMATRFLLIYQSQK